MADTDSNTGSGPTPLSDRLQAGFPGSEHRLCGVIHLLATPGSAGGGMCDMAQLLGAAVRDARAYVAGGIDALIVENFHDAPFRKSGVGSGTIAALTLAVASVSEIDGVREVGVNVLRNDGLAALGIASATSAQFVRINVHTGSMYTDQGLIEGSAAETLTERSRLCPGTRIFADVHVKHATPIAGERIEDAARDAVIRGRADALIVSGRATGDPPNEERLRTVRDAIGGAAPLLVGSGLRPENAMALAAYADGAIVGSAAKVEGDVKQPVDAKRVAQIVRAFR